MADLTETLAAWTRITDAATEGPWEHGDRQHVAGVLPEQFGDGKCAYCGRYGEPTWVGKQLINGKRMLAHAHESAEPWWDHGIYALRGGGSVLVVNDTDEYGYIADPDAEFIAQSRTIVPALLSAVQNVLALHQADEHNACIECTPQDPWYAVAYPCPTVKALTDALGDSDETP